MVLARGDDPGLQQEIVKGNLASVELGALKGNQGDQNYDLPATVDLTKYSAVVIFIANAFTPYSARAKLEPF